jgi:hypothetical protein
MSIPRSKSRSSTFHSETGYLTYIITTSLITSGDELKYRKGLAGLGGRGNPLPYPILSYRLANVRCICPNRAPLC